MRLTFAAALTLLLGAPALCVAQTPELTTLLGRPVFARADTDGAIAKADAALAAEPRNIDLFLAAARARDVALQFHAAIEVYTRGLAFAPEDVRLLRFRGHRYISTRRFDLAAADLRRAVALAPSSFDVALPPGAGALLERGLRRGRARVSVVPGHDVGSRAAAARVAELRERRWPRPTTGWR